MDREIDRYIEAECPVGHEDGWISCEYPLHGAVGIREPFITLHLF